MKTRKNPNESSQSTKWKWAIPDKPRMIFLVSILVLCTMILLNELLDFPDLLRGAKTNPIDWIKFATEMSAIMLVTFSANVFLRKTELKRKRAEDEIKTLKRQMEFILGATKTGLDIIDSEFNIRYIDPEWQKVYGDPKGIKCHDYFMRLSEVCPGCGIVRALETKKETVTEEILIKEDNRPVQVTTIPFQNERGEWLVAEVNVDITERKRAEQILKESEERLKLVLEGAELGTWDQNMKTGEVIRNRRWAEMLGYTLEEIDSHADAWKALIHPDDLPVVNQMAQDHEAGRTQFFKCEHRMRTKSGEWMWILNCGKIIQRDSDGKPVRATGTHTDITERKRAEEALQFTRFSLDNAVDTMVCVGHDGSFIDVNDAFCCSSGYSREELLSMTVHDIDPDYSAEIWPEFWEKLKQAGSLTFESCHRTKDGKVFPVEITAKYFEYNGKEYHCSFARDITERKRAEEEIRSLSKFPSENPNPILRLDSDGIILYANQASKALLEDWGCEVNGYAPLFWRDLVTDAFKNNSKKTVDVECDKQVFSFLIIPIPDSSYVNLYGRDVTERKKAEEVLQVSHHFLGIANRHTEMPSLLQEFAVEVQNFTGAAAVGLRILDKEGNIPYQAYEGFSRGFYELESPLSTKSDQCMCINVIKGVTDPNLPFYTEGGSFYMNGTTRFLASVSEEVKGRTRNACNQFGYESVVLVPIRLGERILGLIHVADPHENMFPLEMVKVLEGAAMQVGIAIQRVWSEEEIRKKNKELEAFVYMVSHDLKNPVVSIQGFCSSILKNQRDQLNEKTLFYLQRVQANASLMSSLLEDLVELSRIGRIEDKKTEISVQGVIKSVWAGVNTSLATQDVEFVSPENLPQVLYSEKRLYQIFSNLLSNAVKFRDEDRKTKVEIGYQEDKDNYTFFVRDNGIGIEQKYHNKIFESFSQLKDTKSEGTGMGLAIVKKIVEANQGKVWVESQKGAGSTFYFTIPKNVQSPNKEEKW